MPALSLASSELASPPGRGAPDGLGAVTTGFALSGLSPLAGRPRWAPPFGVCPPWANSAAGSGATTAGPSPVRERRRAPLPPPAVPALSFAAAVSTARARSSSASGETGRMKKPSASPLMRGSSASSPTKKIGTRPRGTDRTFASARFGSGCTICGAITIRAGRLAVIQPDRLSPGSTATASNPADTAALRRRSDSYGPAMISNFI